MNYQFRKALPIEQNAIWSILQQAILRRKNDGSKQWQDGYPNLDVVKNDIEKGIGYVIADGNNVIGYSAILINDEPAYDLIDGKWLTNGDFVVVHRVAVSDEYLGKGFAKLMLNYIEKYALENKIYSIKADTNFDNSAMMSIFESTGYKYCGEVFFRGSARKAYEKVLK